MGRLPPIVRSVLLALCAAPLGLAARARRSAGAAAFPAAPAFAHRLVRQAARRAEPLWHRRRPLLHLSSLQALDGLRKAPRPGRSIALRRSVAASPLREWRRRFAADVSADREEAPVAPQLPSWLPANFDDHLANLTARAAQTHLTPDEYSRIALEAVELLPRIVERFRDPSGRRDYWAHKQIDVAETAQRAVLSRVDSAALHVAETDYAKVSRAWSVGTVRIVWRAHTWLRMEAAVDAVSRHVEHGRSFGIAEHAWKDLKRKFFDALLRLQKSEEAWTVFEPMVVAVQKERRGGARYTVGDWSRLLNSVGDNMGALTEHGDEFM